MRSDEKWFLEEEKKFTDKPSSGASVGVPANSLQLPWRERYITVLYIETGVLVTREGNANLFTEFTKCPETI
jgi:hypothetical protein